jgi:hypothetical protein
MKTGIPFCVRLVHNSLNIYQSGDTPPRKGATRKRLPAATIEVGVGQSG